MSGAIKINGTSSGSTTITAPASGGDETIELSTALAAKLDSAGVAVHEIATAQTTTSTTYTDLATVGPTVTLTTGTKALIMFGADHGNNTANHAAWTSVAVSGATTLAASDAWSTLLVVSGISVPFLTVSRVYLLTGLTAGSNTFTVKYKSETGSTSSFVRRSLVVLDMGS